MSSPALACHLSVYPDMTPYPGAPRALPLWNQRFGGWVKYETPPEAGAIVGNGDAPRNNVARLSSLAARENAGNPVAE